ncbi:hypothetical protein GG344DRAFT_61738 [Lentinula edodes]|nr:hypothetical protein GG344DRAFT_61738 [Lentinula edodes]
MSVSLRRSSRQAMKALLKRFPTLDQLKLDPRAVDVWAPREVQLEHLGILRKISPFPGLQNVDPDFEILRDMFESSYETSSTHEGASDMNSSGLAVAESSQSQPGYHRLEVGDNNQDFECFSSDRSEIEEDTVKSEGLILATDSRKRKRVPTEWPDFKSGTSSSSKPRTGSKSRRRAKKPARGSVTAKKQDPLIPSVSYSQCLGSGPSPLHFRAKRTPTQQGIEWKEQRKHQYNTWRKANKRPMEVHRVSEGFDLATDSRISKPAWMGLKAPKDARDMIYKAIVDPSPTAAHSMFEGITKIPYVAHLAVAVCDVDRRMFLYRSELTPNILSYLLPRVNAQVPQFVKDIVYPFTENDMLKNSRGDHWFSIAGHDRNNKKEPIMTAFQEANKLAIAKHFGPDKFFRILTEYGCGILRARFPAVVARYQASIEYMKTTFGIEALFGLFFNFCLNAPREGNIAFGVCMIFVYGHFDHREKCWLVIWEAGIALELPPGVFVFYPSSLFLHFNIDLSLIDLPIVTTPNGEKPSKQNSKPLYFCGCNSHEGSQAWAEADGRGSMVWFNQASMFQTSETGFNTLKEAREADKSVIVTSLIVISGNCIAASYLKVECMLTPAVLDMVNQRLWVDPAKARHYLLIKTTFRVFFKKSILLPINPALGIQGDLVVMRAASKHCNSVVNMRGRRDYRLADFIVQQSELFLAYNAVVFTMILQSCTRSIQIPGPETLPVSSSKNNHPL